MALTVLLGGARAGKSRIAAEMARRHGGPVSVVATGEARDAEMEARIARHRAERPASWETIEEPIELVSALRKAPPAACVVVECLTLWIANLLEAGREDEEIDLLATEAAATAAERVAPVVAVTNEVGLGIVPMQAMTRRYRDLLGRVNATWCARAERALLVVAGRVLPLERFA